MRGLAFILLLLIVRTAAAAPEDEAKAAYDRGDYTKAMELSIPLAEAGDGNALANIGNMYAFGWGVPVDQAKALSFWLKAAEKHVGTSMGNMAVCYRKGACGVPQSDVLAAEWWKRAAEHQHAQSMLDLSSVYMNGEGFSRDKIKGLAWAGLAVTNSLSPHITKMAKEQTARIMTQLTQDEIDEARQYSNELVKLIDQNMAKYRRREF